MVQYSPDSAFMNIGSDAQKAHLLFAPCDRMKQSATRSLGGKLQQPVQVNLSGPEVILGTPDTYASDATKWPEYREFLVSDICVNMPTEQVCKQTWNALNSGLVG